MSDDTCGRYDPNPDDMTEGANPPEPDDTGSCDIPVSPSEPAEGERLDHEQDDSATGGAGYLRERDSDTPERGSKGGSAGESGPSAPLPPAGEGGPPPQDPDRGRVTSNAYERVPDSDQPDDQPPGGWLPTIQPSPPSWAEHPRKRMLMTPRFVLLGGIFAFVAPTIIAAFLQTAAFHPPVSQYWAPLTNSAKAGRNVYVSNGCVYCHSGFSRPQDVRAGLYYLYPRESLPGDYSTSDEAPNVFGTSRTGPDLSFEAGYHPDDWHYAHYVGPRFVAPESIMPRFEFLTDTQIEDLTQYAQRRSGKGGLIRYAGQLYMKDLELASMGMPGPPKPSEAAKLTLADIANLNLGNTVNGVTFGEAPPGEIDGLAWDEWVNMNIVERSYWEMTNPLPVTSANLMRGRVIFQTRCIGCHGRGGAGVSLAARFMRPTPADFTGADDAQNGSDASPGNFYYRVLRGIPGSAMENFGTRLRVDDIWRVVMFLKAIPNGGLSPDKVPEPSMYIQWKPSAGALQYLDAHPQTKNKDYTETRSLDPFVLEAQRVLGGMTRDETFSMPGFGPISIDQAAADIKRRYEEMLDTSWTDFQARGETPLPPARQKNSLPDFTKELR
jgi:cbb3-type cytochrome c oxidase subunit II